MGIFCECRRLKERNFTFSGGQFSNYIAANFLLSKLRLKMYAFGRQAEIAVDVSLKNLRKKDSNFNL